MLCVCACGTPAPLPPEDAGQQEDGGAVPLLEVGTGVNTFAALADGDDIGIIFGPQGGYHVWTALRARKDLAPTRVETRVSVRLEGAELSQNGYRLNLVDSGDHYEWYGLQALIPDPAVVDGKSVELRVDVTDAQGRAAFDVRRVVTHRP